MPALTISTNVKPPPSQTPSQARTGSQIQGQGQPQAQPRSRSSSPARPPVSPITPTLASARLAGTSASAVATGLPPRQTFTHAQPNQVGVAPPHPEPITLDANPDAVALRSAIAVLQIQRRRAVADIQALSVAKGAALAEPDAFARDLAAGKVRVKDDAPGFDYDDDDDDDDDEEEDGREDGKPWASLPKPQDVVRCPPVNWAQYAVVGESLDKLHAEQRAKPNEGVPATLSPSGTFEFKGDGEQKPYVGVAAPYTPRRDKLIDKKPRGGKR